MPTWLTRPTVFRRIFGGFLVIIGLVILVSLVSLIQFSRFRQSTEEVFPTSQLLGLFQQYTDSLSLLDSHIERYLVIGGAEIRRNVEQEANALAQISAEIELSASASLVDAVNQLQPATQNLKAVALELVNTGEVDSRQRNEQIRAVFGAVEYARSTLQLSVQATLTQLQMTIDSQESIVATVLTQQIILGVVVVIAATAGSVLTARSIVKPLTQITEVTADFARGDYSQRVSNYARDEIGQLSQSVNVMAAAIQEREAELAELNHSLEQRVEYRTAELADANRDLQVAIARVKEAARAKGEFLANISHELRTPLNAIIGFSDMLLTGMAGDLNDKQRHKITRLKENGSRLLALINDLLDITRIEVGRMDIIRKPFDPHAMLSRVSQQTEVLAHQKGLSFQVYVDEALPHQIFGDEKRLEQIVVNLLSNAFKFTQEGEVSLSVRANAQYKSWTIAVSDTGVGIPPHALNLIFEEFRQVDGSYARTYKGSGLGLSISRNLVRMMDGKIDVQSELDAGSTFTVTLPLDTEINNDETFLEEAIHVDAR
jgi:signal transduction histidine kinase